MLLGCTDDQWECENGECIPADWYCDGHVDHGTAFWGPDCSDGSDENLDTCCAEDHSAYPDSACDDEPEPQPEPESGLS